MLILVKYLSGDVFSLNIDESESIYCIKLKIYEKEGIAPGLQRLTFAGVAMEDASTVSYYGVRNGTTIRLILIVHTGKILY